MMKSEDGEDTEDGEDSADRYDKSGVREKDDSEEVGRRGAGDGDWRFEIGDWRLEIRGLGLGVGVWRLAISVVGDMIE
jgi:hypothetical protein